MSMHLRVRVAGSTGTRIRPAARGVYDRPLSSAPTARRMATERPLFCAWVFMSPPAISSNTFIRWAHARSRLCAAAMSLRAARCARRPSSMWRIIKFLGDFAGLIPVCICLVLFGIVEVKGTALGAGRPLGGPSAPICDRSCSIARHQSAERAAFFKTFNWSLLEQPPLKTRWQQGTWMPGWQQLFVCKHIAALHVFKVGGTALHYFLNEACPHEFECFSRPYLQPKRPISAAKLPKCNTSFAPAALPSGKWLMFASVRDPVERLVSAMFELMRRGLTERWFPGDAAPRETWLPALVDSIFKFGFWDAHLWPQSYFMLTANAKPLPIDYISLLDDLNDTMGLIALELQVSLMPRHEQHVFPNVNLTFTSAGFDLVPVW
eukprot:CAMPEP_0119338448 /NCGR_PEP_ID=MMETSP1333-20130426/96067_1 /TAXON_ID=418940 /ORGANISM="Scyphosphaera apsteinii, Strain RCC1455" /LENGTH=377 /DNA_ID=CAMNT_0007349729 /DNA_START=199 /DNA_END=1329 /DNA_ORIENTATION=+